MEEYLRIKLIQENLALAISLWAAAQRGFITSGFIPGRSEIMTGSGRLVEVSTPLQLGDNTNLIRCLNNQIRSNFALSAINTHLVLSNVYANSPLEEVKPELRAARCSIYLIHHTLSHDMITPVWRCPLEFRQRFEVSSAEFVLDATELDGKEVFWDDFGGLSKYLDLLEYCKQQVASSHELPSSASHTLLESVPQSMPTQGDSVAATLKVTTVPDAPGPVLAGAAVVVGPIVAAPFGTQHPLPIGESLPRPSEPRQLLGPTSDSAAAFVSTCGVVAPEAMIIANEIYNKYLTWCRETGRASLSQKSFGMRLTDLGFERKRRGRGRHWWIGLRLAER